MNVFVLVVFWLYDFEMAPFTITCKLHVADADVSSGGRRLGIGNVSCVELLAWPGCSHGGWPKHERRMNKYRTNRIEDNTSMQS